MIWNVSADHRCTPDNTQIYEGTNQIQRVVMARQILTYAAPWCSLDDFLT